MLQSRLLLVPVFLLAACGRGGPGAGPESSSEDGSAEPIEGELQRREAPRVRVAPVVRKEMLRRLSTTTAIESVREIELLPRIAGVVTEVLVEEAEPVTKDQVLARIDSRDAIAALRDAEVALLETKDLGPKLELAVQDASERIESAKLAHQQAERNVAANEQAGLISRNELEKLVLARDQAFRDLSTSKLALAQAQAELDAQGSAIQRASLKVDRETLNLSYTEITAPFDGVIAERMVDVGDSVSSGAGVFRLTDPEHVRAVIFRPQRELAFFRGASRDDAGAIAIEVVPDALPDETYEGHIQIVSPTIDAASGSFRLTIDLEQPPADGIKPRLLPGMLVRLSIVTERRPGSLAVPKRALRREGERRFLFVVRDERAMRVTVEEGLASDNEVQVIPAEGSTLEAGDRVVVVGNRDLEDGQDVRAEDWLTTLGQAGATAEKDKAEDEESEADASQASEESDAGSIEIEMGSGAEEATTAAQDPSSGSEEEGAGLPADDSNPAEDSKEDSAAGDASESDSGAAATSDEG